MKKNKFKSVLVKKEQEEQKNRKQEILHNKIQSQLGKEKKGKKNKSQNQFLIVLKKLLKGLGKFALLLLRIMLWILIIAVIVIVVITLASPDKREDMYIIFVMLWNNFKNFLTEKIQ